ncbi:chloroplast envelope quinone oxidoreductase homolog [Neltuma alba]|uniref:chloroplast envelope quinone oxidoreductase homolog n=1 Tax=Neltuma alba TaxID=207710 RepID=UPI0010A36EFE|nr:chloroplast envelope quinone oxidoreductase homolog [Prosopis alba]XP_028800408.1 chloroplast envelope quinone oxidoreductase homolog [Prosopis alba]
MLSISTTMARGSTPVYAADILTKKLRGTAPPMSELLFLGSLERYSIVDMARKLMHAIQYDNCGGGPASLKHVEVPVPTPKKDEVLLKVEATGVNPIDWKIQKGLLRPIFPGKLPHIPGTDIAGEIVQVGSQVKDFKVGDKVVAKLSHEHGGGLANFAVSSERLTVARPSEISAAEGSALPLPGLTAHHVLTEIAGVKLDGTGEQKNILVTAASGGVGHFAVQLAKLGNTHVTATCGARNIDFVKSLGADEILDYRTPEGAALRSPSGRKYDAVIHCATGIPWSTFEPQLAEQGKVVDLTPGISALMTYALKKLTFSKKQLVPFFFVTAKKQNLNYLVQLVEDGRLRIVIDSRFPLSKAEDAWARSIDGHATGKIIVE